MTPPSRPTVMFDIDGTLTDTNYFHVLAWRRAFLDADLDVSCAAIHRVIGMGSGMLMEELVGESRDDVKDAWRRHFDELKPEVRAFPGAADLLVEVDRRGATVVLASSSEKDDVEVLVTAIGAGEAVGQVISGGDVGQAKPSPEVFEVAMERAGADPSSTLAVGDTVWDVTSAADAGIGCVGVCSGGISAGELHDAGARAVFRDVADLLDQVSDSPIGQLLDRR